MTIEADDNREYIFICELVTENVAASGTHQIVSSQAAQTSELSDGGE